MRKKKGESEWEEGGREREGRERWRVGKWTECGGGGETEGEETNEGREREREGQGERESWEERGREGGRGEKELRGRERKKEGDTDRETEMRERERVIGQIGIRTHDLITRSPASSPLPGHADHHRQEGDRICDFKTPPCRENNVQPKGDNLVKIHVGLSALTAPCRLGALGDRKQETPSR